MPCRSVIENTIVWSPAGGEVTVKVLAPGAFRITDQGPGISMDSREQVFERFWRGRGERRSGAGLGLAIVREIMTAHGGMVRIEDSSCGGAVFVLDFGNQPDR